MARQVKPTEICAAFESNPMLIAVSSISAEPHKYYILGRA